VTEQYGLPVTRQTSIEFLNSLTSKSPFASEDKALLEDFLNRCDLIKFARYDATRADSELLLDEAKRFVRGRSENPKSQIPSSKEIPSPKLQGSGILPCFLVLGIWSFFAIWGLGFGIS
jgi:hypothetical protein